MQKMQSIVTINESGNVHLKTHTYTDCQLIGFTGGTHAFFSDKAGNIIFDTPTESYGVDGKAIIFSNSSRWDDKYYNADPSIYNDIDRIDVLVFHYPHARILEDIKKLGDLWGTVSSWFVSGIIGGSGNIESGNPYGPNDSGDYSVKVGDSILHGSYIKNLIGSTGGSQVQYGGNISLQTYDGAHYVCAENGGGDKLVANRKEARQWETFTIWKT